MEMVRERINYAKLEQLGFTRVKERLDDILRQHKEFEEKTEELLDASMRALSNAWPKFVANRNEPDK